MPSSRAPRQNRGARDGPKPFKQRFAVAAKMAREYFPAPIGLEFMPLNDDIKATVDAMPAPGVA